MAATAADLSAGVLAMFVGLEDDERLAGQGLAAAFAAAFPSLPADSEIPSQVPEDRYIDHMCRTCVDARRFFGSPTSW